MTPSLIQSQIFTTLRAFLLQILPIGTEVIQAEINRTPEPKSNDFVIMTPLRRPRLATNVDSDADCSFTGSIAGTTLTISSMLLGTVALNATLFGTWIAANTIIQSQLSGTPGGAGTYKVSQSQTVSSEKMACGQAQLQQSTEFTVQLDVHGPNSPDNAQVISTCFRDEYAVEFFAASNALIAPLYADDPRQMPFTNDQSQVEWRWIVEAYMQIVPSVTVPQDFFDVATVGLKEIDATFPAS